MHERNPNSEGCSSLSGTPPGSRRRPSGCAQRISSAPTRRFHRPSDQAKRRRRRATRCCSTRTGACAPNSPACARNSRAHGGSCAHCSASASAPALGRPEQAPNRRAIARIVSPDCRIRTSSRGSRSEITRAVDSPSTQADRHSAASGPRAPRGYQQPVLGPTFGTSRSCSSDIARSSPTVATPPCVAARSATNGETPTAQTASSSAPRRLAHRLRSSLILAERHGAVAATALRLHSFLSYGVSESVRAAAIAAPRTCQQRRTPAAKRV